MAWLMYVWNGWEWQRILSAFHFSFGKPQLNGKRWTRTAAMFLGSRVFSTSQSLIPALPGSRISGIFSCQTFFNDSSLSLFLLSPLSSSPALLGVSLFVRLWPSDRLIIKKHAELNVTPQSTASRTVWHYISVFTRKKKVIVAWLSSTNTDALIEPLGEVP